MMLWVVAAAAQDRQTPSVRPFIGGETLNYIVSYKLGILNIDIALVTFTVTDDTYQGKPVYKINALARTKQSYASIFRMNDTYTVWVDKTTMVPYVYKNSNYENDYTFKSDFLYDWAKMMVETHSVSNKWDAPRNYTFALTPDSADPLSFFYKLRMLDFSRYVEKKDKVLPLVFYDKIRKIRYDYGGRDYVRVKGMGRVAAHKFICELANADGESFQEGSQFEIWLSDDFRKMPLLLKSPIRVGSVVARYANQEELDSYYAVK